MSGLNGKQMCWSNAMKWRMFIIGLVGTFCFLLVSYLISIAFALSKHCCHCFAATGARHHYMTVVGTVMMMISGTEITTWQLLLIT